MTKYFHEHNEHNEHITFHIRFKFILETSHFTLMYSMPKQNIMFSIDICVNNCSKYISGDIICTHQRQTKWQSTSYITCVTISYPFFQHSETQIYFYFLAKHLKYRYSLLYKMINPDNVCCGTKIKMM